MSNLLGVLKLPVPPALAKAAAQKAQSADLPTRLGALRTHAAEASAQGGKAADVLKQRIAEAEAATKAAASGDKAAVAKANRALDVVQMLIDDARAQSAPAAAKPYVPSPEAVRFTKHVKAVLAQIALLEATRSADAPRLKKAVVEITKLGHHEKERAKATAQLVEDLKSAGQHARKAASLDDIVTAIVREHRPGDLVVLMSNGGFGGIHTKMLQALAP